MVRVPLPGVFKHSIPPSCLPTCLHWKLLPPQNSQQNEIHTLSTQLIWLYLSSATVKPKQMTFHHSKLQVPVLWLYCVSSRLQVNVFITLRHLQSELVSTPPASVKGFDWNFRQECLSHSNIGKGACALSLASLDGLWLVKLVHHN